MDKIVINIVEMKNTITKLNEKIIKLENTYGDINNKIKPIFDEDIWSGDVEKLAYDKYIEISTGFNDSINKMKLLKEYLDKTLNSYINSDKYLKEYIDKNEDKFDS